MTKHITVSGIEFIKNFEAYSPIPYICPAGYITIGYGHVVTENEKNNFKKEISKEEAEELLKKDLHKSEKAILRLISVPLTNNQFDALCSFVFNAGSGALQRSTLRAKLNREEYEDAADEFLKWIWAGGRILNGLVKRRRAERDLFISC